MKDNGGINPEHILDMNSNVESLTLAQSAWGTSQEKDSEEDVTEFTSFGRGEESDDFEEECGDKTERGVKAVLGLEVEPWEQPVDDPILMYLHEIGKVSLLTANDERALASKLEEAKYLKKIESLHFQYYGRYPPAVSTTIYLLRHLLAARPMVDILVKRIKIAATDSLIPTISNPKLRAAVDGVIDQELVKAIT